MGIARPETSPSPACSLAAVIAWLAIQLTALMLGVVRVPLAARFAPPGEQLALHALLAAQVIAASLLFPVLMPNWRTAAVVLLTSIPFAQLAAFLSNVPVEEWYLAAVYVVGWLVTLAVLSAATRRLDGPRASNTSDHAAPNKAAGIGVALACAITIGGAAVWYLHAEFGTHSSGSPPDAARYGPLTGALSQIGHAQVLREAWIALAASLIAAVLLLFIAASIDRRRQARAVD